MEYLKIAGLIYIVLAIITALWMDNPKVEDWMEPNIEIGKAGKVVDIFGFAIVCLAWPVLACICVKFWFDVLRINRAFKRQHN